MTDERPELIGQAGAEKMLGRPHAFPNGGRIGSLEPPALCIWLTNPASASAKLLALPSWSAL